jgi:hypothetical protein
MHLTNTKENKMKFDQMLDAKANRREAAQAKYYDTIMYREEKAENMIGELSNGKHYVFPIGGKYREGNKIELISFLIRNAYA